MTKEIIEKTIDYAAMRIARAWAKHKAGHVIPKGTTVDDLEDPEFLRVLAAAALNFEEEEVS